ncbi:MBL fold metallo-hydrolase [Jiella sonneratiae]
MPKNRFYSGPVSDHFDGTRFHNPGQGRVDRRFADLLKWQFSGERARWPAAVPVTPAVPAPRVDGLRATMVGHATVLIQVAGLNVLTDPVFSPRMSPVGFAGPKRVSEPGIRFDDLPPIDVVLLSHDHYDHCDIATLSRLMKRDRPRVVTALGNDVLLQRAVPGIDVVAGDWGDSFPLDRRRRSNGAGGATVDLVPAQHWSRRRISDTRMRLWCGFVLRAGGSTVYFVGDSGFGDGAIFRKVRAGFGAPDLALIPIGAYAPRWFMQPQHMDPEEAAAVFADLGAAQAVAIHWGTVQLTDEPFGEPPARLREALDARGIAPERFRTLSPGESLDAA